MKIPTPQEQGLQAQSSDDLPERTLAKLRLIHDPLKKMTDEKVSLRQIRIFVSDNAAIKISLPRLAKYLKETFNYVSPRTRALSERKRKD